MIKAKSVYKRGQVALYITLTFVILLIILISAVFAPFGIAIASELYTVGDDLIVQSNSTIQNISDPAIRTALTNAFNEASDSSVTNIEVATNVYQYSWVFVIGLAALIAFLYARRLVEFGSGGGFV